MGKKAKVLFLIVFTGCFLALSSSLVFAAECGKDRNKSIFDFFPKDFLATAEDAIKSLGYNIALAEIAPEPDFCGGDTYLSATNPRTATYPIGNPCTGGVVSPVIIGWVAVPLNLVPGAACQYYQLTVSGVGTYTTNCSTRSYTISSGLASNTTYNWSVDAYYKSIFGTYFPSSTYGVTNQPHGSFKTSNCVPPPPPQQLLTVTKSGSGGGTVTSNPAGINCGSGTGCLASYVSGTPVTLSASPSSGSQFDGWSGDADCSDGMVTVNANKTCTATFNLICVPDCSGKSYVCEGEDYDCGCGVVDKGTRDCGWKEVAP